MGRKWNNIKYGKAAKDAARSKVLARFGKEIYMAAKNGGKIGVSGAVAFMFEATALFGFNGNSADEILEGLMEADVDVRDVEEEDGEITVYADQDQFHAVQTALNEMGITEFEVAELTMLPTSTVELEGDALAKFLKLLDVLEDLDDVQQVHHNVELPEEEE